MDAIESPGHVPSTPVAERLFLDLDGQWFGAAGDRWRAEVYGVLQDGGWSWVQLGLHGARDHMLTLRMAPSGGVAQLILALTAWLASSEPRPHLLSIG